MVTSCRLVALEIRFNSLFESLLVPLIVFEQYSIEPYSVRLPNNSQGRGPELGDSVEKLDF